MATSISGRELQKSLARLRRDRAIIDEAISILTRYRLQVQPVAMKNSRQLRACPNPLTSNPKRIAS